MKKIVIGFILCIPIGVLSAQISVVQAIATTTLAKDYFSVTWHIPQYIPAPCETAPGNSIALAQQCFKKIESEQQKLFSNREEAEAFVKTKPNDSYQGMYRVDITNIQIDEIHN